MLSGIAALHPEPSPGSLQQGTLRLCRGTWNCKNWQISTDL